MGSSLRQVWCSGYHVRFTRERPRVRPPIPVILFIFINNLKLTDKYQVKPIKVKKGKLMYRENPCVFVCGIVRELSSSLGCALCCSPSGSAASRCARRATPSDFGLFSERCTPLRFAGFGACCSRHPLSLCGSRQDGECSAWERRRACC